MVNHYREKAGLYRMGGRDETLFVVLPPVCRIVRQGKRI
jgi:hypothetical protein